jgi:predicted acyltransferase (DUF342 family)
MIPIVFYFVLLSQLLRVGEQEAADELATALGDGDEEITDRPLIVPRGSRVSDDAWRVSTPATVGDDCRLHGNIRAEEITLGEGNNVFGSLRARGDVVVGPDSRVHGDVTTRGGSVTVEPGARVLGDVSCRDLTLHEAGAVDGAIRSRGEMRIVRDDDGRDVE